LSLECAEGWQLRFSEFKLKEPSMSDVSEAKKSEAQAIGKEILAAIQAAKAVPSNPGAEPVQLLMQHAPSSLQQRLAGRNLSALSVQADPTAGIDQAGLMKGAFKCTLCTTGLMVGIAAALGGSIILSGGMSIPAVLAASAYSMSGLAVVIAAMTGVSVGAVTALLGVAGTTLSIVCLGLCEAMGAC
jgi:hypothetical protein